MREQTLVWGLWMVVGCTGAGPDARGGGMASSGLSGVATLSSTVADSTSTGADSPDGTAAQSSSGAPGTTAATQAAESGTTESGTTGAQPIDCDAINLHGLTKNDAPWIGLNGDEFFAFSGPQNPIVVNVNRGETRTIQSPLPIAADGSGAFTFEQPSGGLGPAAFLAWSISECPGDFGEVTPTKVGCVNGGPTSIGVLAWAGPESEFSPACILDPGKQYFLNVAHIDITPGGGFTNSCSGDVCSFEIRASGG